MRWILVCLTIVGCARAGKENSIIGGLADAGSRDGDDIPAPDASLIDAPPEQVTLSQNASTALELGKSFNCHRITSGFTRENSYYRVFTLADHGITTTLHVTQVDFAIDSATAGAGGMQPASVRIGTYGGTPGGATLDLSLVRAISSVDIQIPDGSGTRMTVPITAGVAPNMSMIAEVFVPDGLIAGNKLYLGVNGQGERKPGYTRGPDCGVVDPTTIQSLASDNMLGEVDLVMTVTGTTAAPD